MPAHLATRGDLHASGILDCGQQDVHITLEMMPTNEAATSYTCSMSQEELCHAMGVHHQASEHLNLDSLNLVAVDAPLNGSHAFTIHQIDEASETGYSQLPTSTRAILMTDSEAKAHHFIHPEAGGMEHVPLHFDESTFSSEQAKGSGVRRAARWTGWKSNNQVSTESIMKGVNTFKGANGDLVHAVPKLEGQQDLAANAGAMAKLCDINSDNKGFADQYLSNEVESEGRAFYVLPDSAINELQQSLQSNLKPQSQLGDGLRFTATRFGGKDKKHSTASYQKPLHATFKFSRSTEGPQSMHEALTSIEGDTAKVEYNATASAGTTALEQDLAEKLNLQGATLVKSHA